MDKLYLIFFIRYVKYLMAQRMRRGFLHSCRISERDWVMKPLPTTWAMYLSKNLRSPASKTARQ